MKQTSEDTGAKQPMQPMSISLGTLLSVDSVNRVGVAMLRGETTPTYVVFGGLSANRQSVEYTEAFTVGDQVLVAYYSTESMLSSSPSKRGVVICKIAITDTIFDELLNTKSEHLPDEIRTKEAESPVACIYNDNRTGELFGEDIVQFPPTNNMNDFVGQTLNITGDNTNFTVSHSDVALKAGDFVLSVNEFGVTVDQSLWKRSKNLSTTRNNYLIGDTLLDEEVQLSDLNGAYIRINKFGALADGVSDALISADGTVLSRVKQSVDGITKIDVSNCFIVERGGPCVVTESTGDTIQQIDKATESAITDVKNFDFIEDSFAELSSMGVHIMEGGRIQNPVDSPLDTSNSENIKNPITGREYVVGKGRARFGIQADGGILFSDAWGSEIRMFGGDIFITPARRLMITTPEDTVVVAGGSLALSGTELVNVGSAAGPVELAGSVLNLFGNSVKVVSRNDLTISSNSLAIVSGHNINISAKHSIDVSADVSATVTSKLCYVVGSSGALMASAAASLKFLNSTIELGSAQFNILSNVMVSDNKAEGFEIGNISVTPGKGSGFLGCSGYCVVNKGLSVNTWIKTSGILSANAVIVRDVNKEAVGVFKGRRPASEQLPGFNTINVPSYALNGNLVADYSVKNIVKNMFTFTPKHVYTIVPDWFARAGAAPQPLVIEDGAPGGYIYPGKDFWERSGAYIISTTDYYNIYNTPKLTVVGLKNIK